MIANSEIFLNRDRTICIGHNLKPEAERDEKKAGNLLISIFIMSSEITVGSRVAFLFAGYQAIFLIHDFVQPWDVANFFVWQNCFLFWILAAPSASASEAFALF